MFPSPFETALWLIAVCTALAFIIALVIVVIVICCMLFQLLFELGKWIWGRE